MSCVTKGSVDVTHPVNDVTDASMMSDDVLASYVSAIESGFARAAGLSEDTLWTREMVKDRLEDAIKLVHRTAGRVGPKGYGSAMPAYLYSELDLWYQATQTDEERSKGDRSRNRVVPPPTFQQIREADEALEWPMRYVPNEVIRGGLNLWMLSRAVRVPFSRMMKVRGIAERTGVHRRDRAVALIVYGLSIDGVVCR